MEIGMLRSSGVPTVTETSPFSEAPHDTSVDMLAALAATTSALSFILQNGYTKAHWKLRLTSFKTADEKNPIGDIVYRWESEFEVSGQEMSVAVIVNEGMTTGYPLYIWAMGHQSRSMGSDCQLLINLKDPDDIMNWSAEWFKHELQNSHFYTPPNYISIMQKIETVLCLEPGNVHQIDAYYSAFSTAMQEIRMYGLTDRYGGKSLAQRFYNGLPALLQQNMALYDSLHEHTADIRDDYLALQKEV